MGRLWQTLILSEWQPLLAYLPVETVIRHRQELYYKNLSEADRTSDCTAFIEFMLAAIKDSLQEGIATQLSANPEKMRVETRVKTPDAILTLLANNPKLSLREVSVQLGKSLSTIERAVSRLQTEGYLKFEGPKKEGRWMVRR